MYKYSIYFLIANPGRGIVFQSFSINLYNRFAIMDFVGELSRFLSSSGLDGRPDIVPVPLTARDGQEAEAQRLALAPWRARRSS